MDPADYTGDVMNHYAYTLPELSHCIGVDADTIEQGWAKLGWGEPRTDAEAWDTETGIEYQWNGETWVECTEPC